MIKHFTGWIPEIELCFFFFQQHENGSGSSCLDPVMFLDLWKKIGASLAKATPDTEFCSANGKYTYPMKPTIILKNSFTTFLTYFLILFLHQGCIPFFLPRCLSSPRIHTRAFLCFLRANQNVCSLLASCWALTGWCSHFLVNLLFHLCHQSLSGGAATPGANENIFYTLQSSFVCCRQS